MPTELRRLVALGVVIIIITSVMAIASGLSFWAYIAIMGLSVAVGIVGGILKYWIESKLYDR